MPSELQLFFPPFRLDLVNERLWCGAQPLPVRHKTFAVLRYLVEHPGRLVTRDELRRAIWPQTSGSERAPKQCIHELREVLGDPAEAPRFIETMGRRGYRFVGQVTQQWSEANSWPENVANQLSAAGQRPQSPALAPVGREAAFTQLHRALERAQTGERQLVFVTGEPGIGKTTLVDAFTVRIAATPGLWIGRGQCVEHYGVGEAYLPVLEALGRLAREAGGERFLALLGRYAPTWLVQMPAVVGEAEREALQRKLQGTTQTRMLRELAEALEVLTAERTLVLVLEDLQWSDVATLDWLSVLAQRREAARLLLIGTYRPVEVIVHGHPLNRIKQELHQHGQCHELPLGGLTEDAVAEYLAWRFAASLLPSALVKGLYQRTEGNPFFLTTIVDGWVAQGLMRQTEGHWVPQGELSALVETIPQSIRQLIERLIERLSPQEQRVLEAASVAGIEFSAAAVAAAIEAETEQVEEWCERLVYHQLFLRSIGESEWPDGTVAVRYAFLHALYQHVWYERVPAGRRGSLHRRIGERQERAYGDRKGESAAELAVHFERGRDYWRAVQYCEHAGQTALRRAAHHEAIAHLRQGLKLLQTLPDTLERAQYELRLQVALGAPLQATEGYSAPEVAHAYARAQELCQQVEATTQLFQALWGLWVFHLVRAELETAHQLGAQLLRLAQSTHDAVYLTEAHRALGETLLWRGEVALAHRHLEQGLALYDPQQLPAYAALYDLNDFRVLCISRAAVVLCVLGYPDQALTKINEVLALAHELRAAFSLAMARNFAALVCHLRREVQATHEHAAAARTLAAEHGFIQWEAWGTILRGWALAAQGCPASQQGTDGEGMRQISQGLTTWQASGAELGRPYHLALLAEAYGHGGQPGEGLSLLAEALAAVDKTGERLCEAELYRYKGELTLQQSRVRANRMANGKGQKEARVHLLTSTVYNPRSAIRNRQSEVAVEVEAYFRKAIEIARRQQAKLLELRATMSLARLWQQQGKKSQAHKMLDKIYRWFTEGFDTKDLQEAKTLLLELS